MHAGESRDHNEREAALKDLSEHLGIPLDAVRQSIEELEAIRQRLDEEC